jgi:hypothetical protein
MQPDTSKDESALNEDKYGKRMSFNHTDETCSPNSPDPLNTKEDIIKGNNNFINI